MLDELIAGNCELITGKSSAPRHELKYYTQFYCLDFANALSLLSGLPIYAVWDKNCCNHAFVYDREKFIAYDIRGALSLAEIIVGFGTEIRPYEFRANWRTYVNIALDDANEYLLAQPIEYIALDLKTRGPKVYNPLGMDLRPENWKIRDRRKKKAWEKRNRKN